MGRRPAGAPEDITRLRRSMELIGAETFPELNRPLIVLDATSFSCSSDIKNGGLNERPRCWLVKGVYKFGRCTRRLNKIQNHVHSLVTQPHQNSGRGIDNQIILSPFTREYRVCTSPKCRSANFSVLSLF